MTPIQPPLAAPCDPSPRMPAVERLAWLFRHSLRQQRVHPLLHLMQAHRGLPGVLEAPVQRAPERGRPPACAPIDAQALQRHLAHLPALPRVVSDLTQLLRQDEVHTLEIVTHLGQDQTLAARTLRLANSPLYGVSGRVGNLTEAVQVLGFNAVSALLTLSAVQSVFDTGRCPGFDNQGFWKHALSTAVVAQALAQSLPNPGDLREDSAFVAGLLHDIGLLLLTTHFAPQMGAVLRFAREADLPLEQVEQDVLGRDHAQIGAELARHWHFRDSLVHAIAHHHTPRPAGHATPAQVAWSPTGSARLDGPPWGRLHGREGAPDLADIVHAAHVLVHALDLDDLPLEQVPAMDLAAWQRLRLDDAAMLMLLQRCEQAIHRLCDDLEL